MSDKIALLKQRYALEQRIRTLQNPSLTEGRDANGLLARMISLLENVNQQIAEIDQADFSNVIQDKETGQLSISIDNNDKRSYDSHPDHEVQMARSQLYTAARCAIELSKMLGCISEQQGLEGWVQAKITKASDYLESVYHYLYYEMQHPSVEMAEASSVAAYGTFGAGEQNPSADAERTKLNQDGTKPEEQPDQQSGRPPLPNPGGSTTPSGGGSSVVQSGTDQVPMVQIGPDGKMIGTTLMVNREDIEGKKKAGYDLMKVANESMEGKKTAKTKLKESPIDMNPEDPMNPTVHGHQGVHPAELKTRMMRANSQLTDLARRAQNADPQEWQRIARNFSELAMNIEQIRHGLEELAKKRRQGGTPSRGIDPDIRESNEGNKTVYCSQCSRGFSNAGVDAKYKTGFSHCKDHKGMRIIAETSSGASSSGGFATSMGNGNGFASGGIGEGPSPSSIMRRTPKKKKPFAEAGFNPSVSTATTRAQAASRFRHDPDRAAVVYKANKYDPETGLGGYVANRAAGDDASDTNITMQLNRSLDSAKQSELRFADGSTLGIRPSIARQALAKLEGMRSAERHEAIKNIMQSKDAFVGFMKGQTEGWFGPDKPETYEERIARKEKEKEAAAKRQERVDFVTKNGNRIARLFKEGDGPEFTGYWDGKNPKPPGKKMVGGN